MPQPQKNRSVSSSELLDDEIRSTTPILETSIELTEYRTEDDSTDTVSKNEQILKNKINAFLPSQTLYRKGKSFRFPSNGYHAATIPRAFPASNENIPLTQKRRTFASFSTVDHTVQPLQISSNDFRSEVNEDDEFYWEQWPHVRFLPLPMVERRCIRNDILQKNPDLKSGIDGLETNQYKAQIRMKKMFKGLKDKFQIWFSYLKEIEGRFGTSVVSYFVFLRWIFYLNLLLSFLTLMFIVLPQGLFPSLSSVDRDMTSTSIALEEIHAFTPSVPKIRTYVYYNSQSPKSQISHSSKSGDIFGGNFKLGSKQISDFNFLSSMNESHDIIDRTLYDTRQNYSIEYKRNLSDMCFDRYLKELQNSYRGKIMGKIQDFLQGSGWMEYTVMFCGYYFPGEVMIGRFFYNIPLAFLIVHLAIIFMCITMMMSYASKGLQETLVVSGVQQKYCNLIFCGWDFCIQNRKTAKMKHNSIYLEFKMNLAEDHREAERNEWTTSYKMQIYFIRFSVNIAVLLALIGSYYLMFYAARKQMEVQRSGVNEGMKSLIMQFLPSIIITALNFILPLVFNILVKFERFNMRNEISFTLFRTVFLRLASIIILVSSFYRQVTCLPKDICDVGEKPCVSPICWETYVGQQMYKLAVMDFIVVLGCTLLWETPRGFAVRRWKNKLTQILGHQTFNIPTEVLSLVYSQTLCWLGMFYCPLLPVVSVLKTVAFFYLKKFSLLKNCVPEEIPYKASRSNAMFMVVLMLSFFIVVAVMGYSISQFPPSPGCSPFRYYNYIVFALSEIIQRWSTKLNTVVQFIFSSVFAIPAIILLCLAVYYYLTVTSAHKGMVKTLKVQLMFESKDKQFLISRLIEVAQQQKQK